MSSDTRRGTGRATATPDRLGWFDQSLALLCLGSLAIVLVGGFVQTRFGSYSMTWGQAFRAVTDRAVLFDPAVWEVFLLGGELPESVSVESRIVWTIRIPRVVVAVLVGLNLSVSGAIFQAVTRNELASPYVLGVSHGAGFAVLVTLVIVPSVAMFLPLIAAVGGAVAFLIVYAVAWKGGTSPVRLVLGGMVVGMVFWSLQRALFFFAGDLAVVQSALAWITGSLTGVGWEQVRIAIVPTLFVALVTFLAARQLNVLLLGERTASSLGMPVEKVRLGLSSLAVLAAGAAIAVAGIVSFVGLVVPHIVRTLVGTDYRRVLVGCLFAGPALVVAADVGARLGMSVVTGSGGQMPVGIVTGLLGGAYFVYLMRQRANPGEL